MNEKIEKVKAHIKEYKHVYGYGLCGLTVFIFSGIAIRKPSTMIINTVSPIFNNTSVGSTLGGYLRKIVYCPELDKYFGSVKEAADFANVSSSSMSRHLNEHKDHINGLIYKIVAVAN